MEKEKSLQRVATELLNLFGIDGKRWITGISARTKKGGKPIDPEDEKAGSWCLMGGLVRTGNLDQRNLLTKAVLDHTKRNFYSIEEFNDSHRWVTIKKFLLKLAHPYQPKK